LGEGTWQDFSGRAGLRVGERDQNERVDLTKKGGWGVGRLRHESGTNQRPEKPHITPTSQEKEIEERSFRGICPKRDRTG